ncbi:ATP-binding protein [Bdellovibrio sp. HCB337]|uniref:ATP-binding protein n=1 Tax=Bdellovibrio sp. HCB337 TaxID=3394358 RepID=UPI0039A6B9FC
MKIDIEVLNFKENDGLGKVAAVDTTRAYLSVSNHELLTRIPVGSLIAIQGATANEYLISMVEKVNREVTQAVIVEEQTESGLVPVGEKQTDTIRVILIGTFRKVDGIKKNVFKRGADSFPQIERSAFIIEGQNLQHLMNLLGSDLPAENQLQLGNYMADRSAKAIADGNRFFQRHAAILGSTGSGKSWAVALTLERAAKLKFANLIVLDMHGEYGALAGEKGIAKGFRIAGPGDLKTADKKALFLPYWLLNREEMLAMLLDRSDQNAPNQATRFTEHIRSLKQETLVSEKKQDVLETFTVDSPIPYSIADLLKLLEQDDTGREAGAKAGTDRAGPWNGKLTRFISRLSAKIEDRRYGFLFSPPQEAMTYGWLADFANQLLTANGSEPGIKIIDFSEVPSDVLPVVVAVFARVLYNIQFWTEADKRTPFCIVCDEAHLYLPTKESTDAVELRAVEAFERIAKEGRKYGVSLLVVSQRPSDVSRTILSQCNNFMVLRLTNDQDQSVVRKLMPDSMAGLTDILPLLDVGEALLLGDSVLLPTRIKLDQPQIKPHSATLDFWTDWNTKTAEKDTISKAVESLRKQKRGL